MSYISRWERPERPEGYFKLWFCHDAATAACWATREDAESFIQEQWARMEQRFAQRFGLKYGAAASKDAAGCEFTIEQRAPNEFVIFFDALPVARQEAAWAKIDMGRKIDRV